MLFATFDYFVFLPIVALIHLALEKQGARAGWIVAASLIFYAAWNPLDTVLLLGVIGFAFGSGIALEVAHGRRHLLLPVAMATLLAPMLYYKYLHFAAENLAIVIPSLPVPPRGHMPIGVSFYTFQAIAYVVDVQRGMKAERKPFRFAAFLLFFPHLVAGPILRASTLLAQLNSDRRLSREDVGHAVGRLCAGLVKKVLVADILRIGIVDSVFTDPGRFTGPEVMIALYAYSLQIYCDFSGYTDFAIGSARLFGFHIPENFNRPYQALSVAGYWRRWHITLSDWVRDYVYYPLGGSRGQGWAPYRNTFVTLLILGAWHGANWTFVLYGLLHGVAVATNRWWRKSGPGRTLPEPGGFGVLWRFLLTFHFVVLARILFRAESLTAAAAVVRALGDFTPALPRYSVHASAVLVLGYIAHFTPVGWRERLRAVFTRLPAPVWGAVLATLGWASLVWGPGDTLAFIYHDF